MHITVRRDTCFWDGRPSATKCEQCEKDGKRTLKEFEEVRRGHGGFSNGYTFLCFTGRCSSHRSHCGSGCILALCLRFGFQASLPGLSSQFPAIIFDIATIRGMEAYVRKTNRIFEKMPFASK